MRASSMLGVLTIMLIIGMLFTQAGAQCPGNFPTVAEDEAAVSLGKFRIWVHPRFRSLFAGNPLYDPAYYDAANGALTSETLEDPNTIIGVSVKHEHGTTQDLTGLDITGQPDPIQVGFNGSEVDDADFLMQPPSWQGGSDPVTWEIHTEIVQFTLLDPWGMELRAGLVHTVPMGGNLLPSYGEVESIDGDGEPQLWGESFFDIYVEVDLPLIGNPWEPVVTLYNPAPLLVKSDVVCPMPPTVVYIHENPEAVPIRFRADHSSDPANNWYAGDLLGYLVLAGHGVMDSANGDFEFLQSIFNQAWDDMQGNEMPLPCFADANGDVNGDGIPLSVGDMSELISYLGMCGPEPDSLFKADLNGDCVVDTNDLVVFQDYFIWGMSVFDQYGGYPVLTCCDVAVELIPDTARIFGMINASSGTACYDMTGGVLTVHAVAKKKEPIEPTTKLVDAEADGTDGDWSIVEIILENLDPSGLLPVGASMAAEIGFSFTDQDDTFNLRLSQTNTGAPFWDLGVQSSATAYTVRAYRNDTLVFNADSIPVDGLGWIYETAKGVHPVGFKGAASGKPSSIIAWQAPDGVYWTWAAQGVDYMAIDRLVVIAEGIDSTVNEIAHVALYSDSIPSFTILSESYTYNYGGAMVTNIGNSSMEVFGTTLVVSMAAADTGGVKIEDHTPTTDMGEYEVFERGIILENPNLGGGLSPGASLAAEFVFAASPSSESFPMESFFDYAGSNTWNLRVQSPSSNYTVHAYNNGSLAFYAGNVPVDSLGYIVETAKGVHPVGFKGAASGKPSTIIAWQAPDGVEWTWAEHAVADLTIDYLRITAQGGAPTDVGIASATMRAHDLPSFTILDIETVSACCSNERGNVDGDPDDEINVADLSYLVDYLFRGGPPPSCDEEGDVDGSGGIDVSDLGYIVDYLFRGGPPPPGC